MNLKTRRLLAEGAESTRKTGVGVALQIVGDGAGESHVPWVRRRLKAVLKCLKIKRGVWTIKVARDREMKRLHGTTLGIWGTTDVLTFDLRERGERNHGEGQDVELDTVVCLDEARRRARELGHDVREELLLYCVHSLLHVQGYDDRAAAQARRMHLREDELLVAAGAGAVYAGAMHLSNTTRNTKRATRKTRIGGASLRKGGRR